MLFSLCLLCIVAFSSMNFCFASHLCALNILFSCYVALFGCVAIILYGKENENRNKKKQTMEGEIQVRALFSYQIWLYITISRSSFNFFIEPNFVIRLAQFFFHESLALLILRVRIVIFFFFIIMTSVDSLLRMCDEMRKVKFMHVWGCLDMEVWWNSIISRIKGGIKNKDEWQ